MPFVLSLLCRMSKLFTIWKKSLKNEIVKHNPFYISSQNSFDYYSVFDYKKISELHLSFYKLQESDILYRVTTESNEINKAILQNSLEEIQGKLNELE